MLNQISDPRVGQRVLWYHGRTNYVDIGEIGTITEVRGPEDYTVVTDAEQPLLSMKDQRTYEVRNVVLTTDTVYDLAESYRENASRFQILAKRWEDAARKIEGAPNA